MTNEKEMIDFRIKLSGLYKAFSDIPLIEVINDRQEILSLHCYKMDSQMNINKVDMSSYSQVMLIGKDIVNINGNSVDCNIEIIVKAYMNIPYIGYIGTVV